METFRGILIGSAALILITFSACDFQADKSLPNPSAFILLFDGRGTSPGDVSAVQAVLESNHLEYATANSSQLDAMSEAEIRQHRLLIIPGGNFVDIGNGLRSSTAANIRNAVQNGMSYLGICAGAFFAGNSPYNGLNLTSGARFSFYSAEARGVRKTAVAISTPGAPTLDQYWEDGPQLSGWGAVVARYPDRTPAVVEGSFGSGSVILTGVHPEAPERWRRGMNFTTPADADHAYAATLIRAALNRTWLAHF